MGPSAVRANDPVPAAPDPARDAAERRAALRSAAPFMGALVVLVGLAAIVGWWCRIPALTAMFAGWPVLTPNSAVMLVLCGVGLIFAAPLAAPPWAVVVARICATVALAFAGLTLFEYVARLDVGLDKLLVRAGQAPHGRYFGRSSPQTATSMFLASAALLSLDRGEGRGAGPAQILAFVSGSIPAVALLGYAFDIPEFYRAPTLHPSAGMGLHTAVALLVLDAGILAARPEVGPVALVTSGHAGGATARHLLLGLLAFFPLALLIVAGRRLGLYGEAVVSALLAFFALVEGSVVICLASARLDADDVARERVEAQLRASDTHNRELFEQAAEGIFIADIDGRYTDVNGAGCRMLGRTREQIVGQLIRSLVHPGDLQRLAAARQELLAGGSQTSEWRVRRGDGSWLPVEVTAKILGDGSWQAFVRDITERRRHDVEVARAHEADRRLYASEAARRAWLMSIIDQMPEGIILLNESGGVEAMNRALLALASDPASTVDLGENPNLFDVRSPDGTPIPFTDYLVVRALRRGEVATDHEHLVRLKDGRFVPVLVSAAPVRDAAGRITGAIAVIRDITARKELERLREEWASVVAHDLRQPAGAILLTAESLVRLRDGQLSERERKAVERIRSAAKRLSRMIEDLLDASRIEAKRLSIDPRPFDLRALVDTAVEGHREGPSPLRVAVHGETMAFVDPDRILQVLDNLISNATKYGRPGADIQIDCVDRGLVLEVVVTNQGAGIAAEELPQLFSRFGRTRDARAERTPGIGLGLYIAHGLVEAHGGHIWAESVPGRSTSFHFTVPAAARHDGIHPDAGQHAPG
jgi:PAS domain S-box-containing protein